MVFPGLWKINVTYERQWQHQIRTFVRKNTREPKDGSVKPTPNTSANFFCAVFALVCIQSTLHPVYDFRGLLWSFMWHCLCDEWLWYTLQQCCQHNQCVLNRSSKFQCCYSDIAHLRQQCHNTTVSQHNSVTTQQWHNTTLAQHNSGTIQRCHNTTVAQNNSVTKQHNSGTTQQCHNTTVAQHNSVKHNSGTTQQCHNTSVTTQQWHNTTVAQHNSGTTQQCHNATMAKHNSIITQQWHNTTVAQHKCHNTTVAQHEWHNTTLSQHNNVTTQQCHNTKSVIFREKLLKVLKCYNFVWVQRRRTCSPAASFANCVMTLRLLKVHLQTFLSIPITQKCQILSCVSLVANELYVYNIRKITGFSAFVLACEQLSQCWLNPETWV